MESNDSFISMGEFFNCGLTIILIASPKFVSEEELCFPAKKIHKIKRTRREKKKIKVHPCLYHHFERKEDIMNNNFIIKEKEFFQKNEYIE